jgi:hypothetical protein
MKFSGNLKVLCHCAERAFYCQSIVVHSEKFPSQQTAITKGNYVETLFCSSNGALRERLRDKCQSISFRSASHKDYNLLLILFLNSSVFLKDVYPHKNRSGTSTFQTLFLIHGLKKGVDHLGSKI